MQISRFFASIAVLVLSMLAHNSQVLAADLTPVRYIHDWRWEGPAAPLLLAKDRGYFERLGLDVTIEPGKGSVAALPLVDSGEYQIGSADINSLIKYRQDNAESSLKAVYVIYNAPPFSVIGRRAFGVVGPSNLHGKVLGAPARDGAFAQWKSFATANGLKDDRIQFEDVSFGDREKKLASGEVQAITGYSFTSMVNLNALGVSDSELSLMLMSDFGLDLYGNAIIVNSEFAEQNPMKVSGFLSAFTKGLQQTIANPAKAVNYVLDANADAIPDRELRRLIMSIGHNYLTDEVRANGFGDLDDARLENAIVQLAQIHSFTSIPSVADIFDRQFLLEVDNRMPGDGVDTEPAIEDNATSVAGN